MDFSDIKNGASSANLSDLDFGEQDFEALAEVLCSNTTLTSLDLSNTGMTLQQFRPIALALKRHNRTLKKFRFTGNSIGCIGAKLFADALSENNMLNYFTVEDNRIGFDGAVALASCLKASTTLQVIGVRFNDFFASGASFFSGRFARCCVS